MAYRFDLGDVAYLGSKAGRAALDAAGALGLTESSLIGDLARLKTIAGPHAAALAETVLLRRRVVRHWGGATGRMPTHGYDDPAASLAAASTGWLFTDEALQQASPPVVAVHRAERLARHLTSAGLVAVHDVTSSIGTDVAALAAVGACAIGSDLDPVRLAMARHNLAAAGLAAPLLLADARTAVTRRTLRYADPARRDGAGRRITSADTIPTVADLDAVDPARPPVLRLPPAIDYETLARPGEIEIVSWDGTVREAVAWPPPLADARRRATILDRGGRAQELTDADPAEDAVTGAGRYLVDPDPAVVRAHLVEQYAARHGLTRLDPHLAYLTGPAVPAGVRGFEILDAAPYSEKAIRAWTRRDDVGTLEIKQRGTPVVPDNLRRRIRPTGDRHVARTLVVARIGPAATAFWCTAVRADPEPEAGA